MSIPPKSNQLKMDSAVKLIWSNSPACKEIWMIVSMIASLGLDLTGLSLGFLNFCAQYSVGGELSHHPKGGLGVDFSRGRTWFELVRVGKLQTCPTPIVNSL
jgi:hypothetical protein